jgi:DNA-binding NtrC family response regulator
MNLKALVEDYERRLIEEALGQCAGNQRRAALSLGVLPTTLHEKIKRLGLRPIPHHDPDAADSLSPSPD